MVASKFETDRAAEQRLMPQIINLLKERYSSVERASDHLDLHCATDLICDRLHFAVRMRWRDEFGTSYLDRYPFDFTVRFSRIGSETEHSKIMSGFGDRFLYLHTPDGTIIDWFEIDLSIFRVAIQQHGIEKFATIKLNKDQTTSLAAFDLRKFAALKLGLLTAASNQDRIALFIKQMTLAEVQAELRGGTSPHNPDRRKALWARLDESVRMVTPSSASTTSEPSMTDAERAGHPNGFVGYDKDGHFVHFCQCGRNAPFGYGVNLAKGQLGKHYCRDHRPPPPAPSAAPPPRAPDPPPFPPAQGDLF